MGVCILIRVGAFLFGKYQMLILPAGNIGNSQKTTWDLSDGIQLK